MLVLEQLEPRYGDRVGIAVHLAPQENQPEAQRYQHDPAPPASCRFEPRWLRSEALGRHP